MDYGAILKKKYKQLNKKSAHYAVQVPFKGSDREIRGRIIKYLTKKSDCSELVMVEQLQIDKMTMKKNLLNLQREGFICKKGDKYRIN